MSARRYSARGFAYTASFLMLLMAFQTVAGPAEADSLATSVLDSPEESAPDVGLMSNSTNASEQVITNQSQPAAPAYYSYVGDGVESFGSPPAPTVSLADDLFMPPRLSVDGGTLSFRTTFGTYIVNASHPYSLTLAAADGVLLVRESYFFIRTDTISSIPANGTILEARNDSLLVAYDVVTSGKIPRMVGRMLLSVDFSVPSGPKIASTVLKTDSSILNWRVVWQIAPLKDASIACSGIGGTSTSVDSLVGLVVPTSNLSVGITPSQSTVDACGASLVVNWSDAKEGALSIAQSPLISGEIASVAQVTFSNGRSEIDPTIVATTTSTSPTEVSCQRKVFHYDGYYWTFYYRGDYICYKRSADGITWSVEFALTNAPSLYEGAGFDVAQRDGKVAIAWVWNNAGSYSVCFVHGTILGTKIQWSSRLQVRSVLLTPQPITVAIGTDGTFWLAALTNSYYEYPYTYRMFEVLRSFDGSSFEDTLSAPSNFTYNRASSTWFVLSPFWNGNMALLEAWSGVSGDTYVRSRLYYSSLSMWLGGSVKNVGISTGSKSAAFSAVATMDGTIHMAFNQTGGGLAYVALYPDGTFLKWPSLTSSAVTYPSISLDNFGDLHIFYVEPLNNYAIKHIKMNGPMYYSYSPMGYFYTPQSGTRIKGLTSWVSPIESCAMIWTESNTIIKFGSIPLPYGTPGTPVDPWSRDGLSPYGTYLSSFDDYVSPGSGLLTLKQTDVSVSGRSGLDLQLSRIYQQPRYFRNDTGNPYTYKQDTFPFCNLGPEWSLDLPWMDTDFIHVQGGMRFVLQWGNNGNEAEFENHDGAHFLLRRFAYGPYVYYELTMSSGLRFILNISTNTDPTRQLCKPVKICDSQGYDAANPLMAENCISFSYNSTTDLLANVSDSAGRSIALIYDDNGLLRSIKRPDGGTLSFAYNSHSFLSSVSDPMSRVTSFDYVAKGSPASYCLSTVTYPTGAQSVYSYSADYSAGTEVRSYLVTMQKTWAPPSGADPPVGQLFRQADYDYKICGGKVTFVRVTQRNGSSAIQGYTEYIFQSQLKYTSETQKDPFGVQLTREDTWYDSNGQPSRIDTYRGSSQSLNYSEYTGYDDWGNVIFKRDALGHETYYSYGNTQTENSFQGGSVLTRTSTGKVFYDSFDDWDFSDWSTYTEGGWIGLVATFDPPNAPALALGRGDRPSTCVAYHPIPAQSADFVMQLSWWTSSFEMSYVLGRSGTTSRLNFSGSHNSFQYYNSSSGSWVAVGSYAYYTWYDIGFVVHVSANKYDIYIDGVLAKSGATLIGSGAIDSIRFQEGDVNQGGATTVIDSIRLYKSLSVTVSGGSGYVAELYDVKGNLLDRSKNGILNVAALPLSFPPAYIKMSTPGFPSFQTPMMDVWGGDVYSFADGTHASNIAKYSNGFGAKSGYIADDNWPGSSTNFSYPNDGIEGAWVADPDYSVSGSSYHQSEYRLGVHYHGFKCSSGAMDVYSTNVILQYVWLPEEGKIPYEIKLQYYYAGSWRAAWWGQSDEIQLGNFDSGLAPVTTIRVGDMPTTTGKWIQLAVSASDLGINGFVYGVVYSVLSGTARWDFTSRYSRGLYVNDVPNGYTVDLTLDNGQTVSATASTSLVILDTYPASGGRFPVAGVFKIKNGASLIYESQWVDEIYNLDMYSYSNPKFYPNNVKSAIHNALVGSMEYQVSAGTVSQETYVKYDSDGNAVETKSNLGSGWVYSRAGYDQYGHQLWSTDQTGRATVTEYTVADYNTYPKSTRQGWRIDTFDTDNSWTTSPGSPSWMSCTYSSARSYSPDRSIRAWFSGAPQGSDSGSASVTKEFAYSGGPVQELSVWMYLESWYHGGVWPDLMDTGIKMRLYDSSNTNYATYTYWLACWYYNTNNRSAPDQYTKVVYGIGDLPMSTWKNVVLYPSTDWPSIDWSRCAKIGYELYVYAGYAYQDYLTIYYDNFAHNDFAKNAKTTYSFHTPTGNLLAATDPLDRTTSQQYDVLGRVVRVNNSDGSYRTIAYDDTNNKVTMLDELGHKTVIYFDKIGRTTKVERWGSGTSAYSTVTYAYNWQDQVASYTDERGHVTTYAYDYLGRQTRVTNPDSTYGTVTYDDKNVTYCSYTSGNVLTHKTVMVMDVLGRLNATKEHTTSTAYNQTLMAYDAVGNLLTVRDAKGQVTGMAYDSLNRLTRTTYPDSLYEMATYDAAGRALTKTDREGNVTSSSYYTAGNLVKVVSPSDTISRSYDAAGQLLQLKSTLGTISYAYNTRGWVKSLTEVIGSNSYQVRFGYDTEGKQTWVLYPSGLNVSYGYDSYDRVTTVTKQPSTTLLTITYNLDDTIASETTGDGTKVTTYAYNSRDWVTGINMKLSGTIKLVLLYSYDDVGNVKQLVVNTTYKASTAKTETYAYDWLDRLRSASGGSLPSGLTYKYDTVGNRISKGSVTYTYGSYNQLTGDGTWNYNHDGNGNEAWKTKSTEKWNYQFSSLDQLTKVVKGTKSGQTWTWTTQGEYWYDANGAMAKSLQGGVTTEYVYLGHDPLCEKSTGVFTDYIYVNGHMAAKQTGSDVYYYIRDALGSTRLVYSGTSQVFSVATYAPFGTPVGVSGTDQKWKYAGEMLVGAAGTSPGLYYIGARWMDPELGRFVSLDPQLGKLSSPQTLDRYVYCVNNPLRFTDPTGEGFWSGASKWWDKNWQTIALVAVCAAITIGTGGAGAGLAVAVAYGVFAGASTNVALAYLQSGGQLTLQGAVSAAVSGAITGGLGAITAGVGSGAISLGGSLGARIAGSTFARLGAAAGIGALGGEGSYLAGEATKMAVTGGREGKITLRGMLFSAAAGTATGFMTGGLKSLGYKPGLDDFPEMNYPQAMKAMLPGAFFTAVMSTLKYSARPWTEGDRALTFGAQAMMPTFQGG